MTSDTTGRTLQMCNNCGGGAPVDVHFCPQCTKVLAIGRQGDYFAFLGVPRKLNLDAAELERSFRTLSRQFHPDYFYNAEPAERRASLDRSSYLNDAYRTLKQPIARIAYLLEVEGAGDALANQSRGGPQATVPPSLLEEVFELNEELDAVRELRTGGASPDLCRERLERARRPIEARQSVHEDELRDLSKRWDDLVDRRASRDERKPVLDALAERVLERNYINNLLAGIERELAG